ncbi:hypothetical protein [Virgibacillus halodenitrificans]|uniref:hypothetical protein n=1 Tax=Virgibacillus halodenitrificans TaxID=1482 RepID=UPI000EF55341|nr:hypothetical protein [Virgibacillus halodenitrificans]
MFKKTTIKATVSFRDSEEGFATSSTTIPLNDKKLIEYLRETYTRYGSLVIEYISEDGEVHLSTERSVKYENQEDRIAEIGEVIRDYVNNRAIPMEAHTVLVDGKLKGVFGKESLAELKRKNLISKGTSSDSVIVKPIQVNSFQDLELGEGK